MTATGIHLLDLAIGLLGPAGLVWASCSQLGSQLTNGDTLGVMVRHKSGANSLISAILANDTPVIMAVTFVFSCLVDLFNLIADVLYGWLDPRITFR